MVSLVACSNKISSTVIEEPNNSKVEDNEKIFSFKAEILEVLKSSILVKPLEGENELNSSDKISIGLSKIEVPFNLVSGQIVEIVYDGIIAESYPAQIFGVSKISLIEETREEIQFPTSEIETISFNDKVYIKNDLSEETIDWLENYNSLSEEEQLAISYIPAELYELCGYPTAEYFEVLEVPLEVITYNGKEYNKSELCNATIEWLELSEEERMLSSYFPPEFVENDICDLDNIQEDWGVILEAQNVTSKGLTLVCHQSCLEEECELSTGSYFVIQKLEDEGFVDVSFAPQDYDIAWTMEAWIIAMDSTTSWDVDWEWIYGELPSGEYRLGKEIMKFNGPGDYETEMIYAHFTIK